MTRKSLVTNRGRRPKGASRRDFIDDAEDNFIELYAGPSFAGYLSVVAAAGSSNDFDPGVDITTLGRLDINPSTGDSILTGLLSGSDGQGLRIRNPSATHNLTCTGEDVLSAAAHRFSQGFVLQPGDSILAVYYAGSVNRWVP